MNTCLITVCNPETGYYMDHAGAHNGARMVFTGNREDVSPDDVERDEAVRQVKMWACEERDVDAVVGSVSRQWPGYEIKIFNLTSVMVRTIGDVEKKQVTKDGILPV